MIPKPDYHQGRSAVFVHDLAGYLDNDLVVFYDHSASRDQRIISENLNLFILQRRQLDDRPPAHPEQMMDRHDRVAENDGEFYWYLID